MKKEKQNENQSDQAIIVKSVSKYFTSSKGQTSIKYAVTSFLSKNNPGKKTDGYWALNGISFDIKKGEFFGIVGRNGSGKSTLLKIIAGVYSPTKGHVFVDGKLVPFIELGVGFNPELTGKDNIFLNGALLGFSRKEMKSMYDEIVDFAELSEFMDVKLKNFSSGMQVRLAFSIAIRAKSEVLLLDEVLAVGDEAFQKKCHEYFVDLKKQKQTVVLVTHDMTNIEKFCDRVLVMDKSESIGIYKPSKAVKIYGELNRNGSVGHDINGVSIEKRWGTRDVIVESVSILVDDQIHDDTAQGEKLYISIKLQESTDIPRPVVVGIGIYDSTQVYLAGPNSQGQSIMSNNTINYVVDKNPLNPGTYTLEVAIFDPMLTVEYDHIANALKFEVFNPAGTRKFGKVELNGSWEIKK